MARRIPIQVMAGCRGRISVPELRRAATRVLDAEEVARSVAVEIVLADSASVRDLNRLYRGRDEPTDVLSFAQMDAPENEAGAVAFVEPPEETPSLGEVIVCVPVAEAQAQAAHDAGDERRTAAGEVVHLLVHGVLHLLGYDHEQPEDAARMQAREDEHLLALGYEGAYAHGHQD